MERDETITRSLLMGLSADGLENVLSAFQSRSYAAGSTIVEAGEEGDELFLIAAGKVRVWAGDASSADSRTLSVMGPGEHFGEASVISGIRRTATVTAVTYVETLVLCGENYHRLVKDYPQLLENLSRSLTSRLTTMNQSIQSPKGNRRGIHSLAVIVDHPCGWPLAQRLLNQLRGAEQLVQPLLVADNDLLLPEQQFDRDAMVVSLADLAHTIAERSSQALTITIAAGKLASEAAVHESNRVIFACDAHSGLSKPSQELLDRIPGDRRPLLAWMFNGSESDRPVMHTDQVASVRCCYQGTDLQANFAASGVTRLFRSLMGKRIGLALGGGGARGIAHIGVLEVLETHGVVFDSVAGTSAGAIVAAAHGAGFKPEQIGDFFRKEMIPPKWMARRSSLRRMFLLHSFRGGRFETKLRRYLGQMTFDQADLPLAITTLDLISGEQQVRRRGDLVRSVLQSINHPVFGRPIIEDQQMLVDGGVLMNVPASVLRGEGCNHVISIDVGSTLATDFAKNHRGELKSPGYLSTLLRTMDISRRHSSALHREDSDLIIIPQTSRFRIEDFHAVDALIEAGRHAGEKAVQNVIQVIDNLQPKIPIA